MTYRMHAVTGEPVNVDAYRLERHGFIVVREWEATDGTVTRDGFHAVSLTDTSSPWSTVDPRLGYDASCGWCWLNAPHTADAHSVAVNNGRGV